VRKEIPRADIDRCSIASDAPVGRLRRLGPTVRLSEIPSRWAPAPGPARLQQARLARPRGGLTGHRAHPEKGVSSFDAAYADCRNASAVTVALF
jgi:hypothetical protein